MILNYFSPKVEKRDSPIEGRGLFAKSDIAAGETIVVKGSYVMTTAERDTVGETLGPSDIQIDDALFIGPATESEREGGMMHLNHSWLRMSAYRVRSPSSPYAILQPTRN